MSTSGKRKRNPHRSFLPTTALAQSVAFNRQRMQVTLTDGRILSLPLTWFPRLRTATPRQRRTYEIGGGGVSLHWPGLDEDLSIAGLMAGVDPRST